MRGRRRARRAGDTPIPALLAACEPGLEPVVASELEELGLGPAAVAQEGLLRLECPPVAADVPGALGARTADDLYVEVWAGGPGGLAAWTARAAPLPAGALALHRRVLAGQGRRPRGRLKVTCFVRDRSDLRRRDVEASLGRQLLVAHPGWRLDPDRPDAEVVVFVDAHSAVVALRLTDPAFRHRGYGRAIAALSPTVAAALVRLSAPAADDRFLDPCCGGGTILLERALIGLPYAELLGGDLSEEALSVARANFGPRHQPWTLRRWDARHLPLPAASVSRVACNLPFGVQLPAAGGVAAFTAPCLAEAARVLRPGGRMVFLWPARPEVGTPPGVEAVRRVDFLLAGRPVAARVYRRPP